LQDLNNILFNDKADESALMQLQQEYPWCSLTYFKLLQSYQQDEAKFNDFAKKAALYFPDINKLKGILSSKSENIEIAEPDIKPEANMEKTNEPEKLKEEELPIFEPLYKSDYFASQGIKVTEEPMTTDKIGKQLKSFTEWLKTMKKIPAEKLPTPDAATEKKIQSIADDSNTTEEVITEAMAEVLEKQGKTDKAIEIYQKLSLLNPSKSAYFAAQINNLKAS
jgi:tetratricopeptide (TPR) repeat protein